MKNGTKEDYLFLDKHEKNFASKTADRILNLCLLTDNFRRLSNFKIRTFTSKCNKSI
jgi:hypothetical protein